MTVGAVLWHALALASLVVEVLTDTARNLNALALASSGVPVAAGGFSGAVSFSWRSAEALAALVVPVFVCWASLRRKIWVETLWLSADALAELVIEE